MKAFLIYILNIYSIQLFVFSFRNLNDASAGFPLHVFYIYHFFLIFMSTSLISIALFTVLISIICVLHWIF